MRGQLTKEIKEVSRELLGYKINQTELRLMPYLQYEMVNNQRIDPSKINLEERNILSKWRKKGWIEGGCGGLSMTEEFWNAINKIIWLGYVIHE